jgi:hypothetical protein
MPTLENPTEWPETAKAALTRKIGPLHVWGWVAIIAGGGAAIYLVKKGTLKLPTSSTTAAVTNPVSTAVAGGFAGNYGSGGGASSGVSSSPAPIPDQTAAGGVGDTAAATSGTDGSTGVAIPTAAGITPWASTIFTKAFTPAEQAQVLAAKPDSVDTATWINRVTFFSLQGGGTDANPGISIPGFSGGLPQIYSAQTGINTELNAVGSGSGGGANDKQVSN